MGKTARFDDPIIVSLHDLDIIDEIKEIFYENTGLVVSFHYPDEEKQYDFYPKKEKNEFCRLVQSTPEGMRLCCASDAKGLSEARKNGTYAMYKCHAGLIDVVIPLVCNGREIGSIYTGQIATERPGEKAMDGIDRLSRRLGLPREKLKRAYREVKVVCRDHLRSSVRFLALMANYILSSENELALQRRITRQQKELLLKEKEKVKLENELKQLSISILELDRKTNQRMLLKQNTENTNRDIVSKAQLFIKSNYEKDIMLGDVAKAVYISPNYFSTLFRQLTGSSFSRYLTKMRIEAAERLLAETDIPIKKIVSEVGFRDYNYFNRIFKRYQGGITPARYRSRRRGARFQPAGQGMRTGQQATTDRKKL